MFPEPTGFPDQPGFPEGSGFPDTSYRADAHEAGGRDSGALDLGGLVGPPPAEPAAQAAPSAPLRRPLHMGPPVPEATGGVVRSLADRGPAAAPAPVAPAVSVLGTPAAPTPFRRPGPPATGPEYLDIPRAETVAPPAPQPGGIPPQTGAAWAPEPVPAPEPALAAEPPVVADPEDTASAAEDTASAAEDTASAAEDTASAAEDTASAAEAAAAAEPQPEPVAVPDTEPLAAAAPEQPHPAEAPAAEPVAAPAETVVQA
ncbi:5,6-dimethylbenzimidazole synthase, partial [Streptomyces sp. H34-S5]|nr:5,6-dimethylbenzimidazole synthase [Streptomyces sp. H34-S5]